MADSVFFFQPHQKPPIVSYFTKHQCFACIIPEAKIVILCFPSNAQTAKEKRLCLFPFMFGKSTECTTFKRDEDETRHNEHPVFHSENQTAEKR